MHHVRLMILQILFSILINLAFGPTSNLFAELSANENCSAGDFSDSLTSL